MVPHSSVLDWWRRSSSWRQPTSSRPSCALTDSGSNPTDSSATVADCESLAPSVIPFAMTPHEQARCLMNWLQVNGKGGGWATARAMRRWHTEMCLEFGWRPHAWNPVGRALALLTSAGKKIYRDVGDGVRVRVYPLPAIATEQG